jgi:hypothetical protein
MSGLINGVIRLDESEIEIEILPEAIRNTKKGNYISIDVPPITWLTIAKTRLFAKKLNFACDCLEKIIEKKKKE